MGYEPVAVALKFGFIAVLYLFLLWVTRSALRDLRQTAAPTDAPADFADEREMGAGDPSLVVVRGAGLAAGNSFDVFGGLKIGRSADNDIRIADRYASQQHARVHTRRGNYFIEDLNSTNGTLLNAEPLHGDAALHPGDVIRIGDTELRFEE